MRWTAIGSDLFCPVAVCRRPGELALFARGASGELFRKEWQDGGWSEVQSLGAPMARLEAGTVPAAWQLAACSGDSKWIRLFAGSPDGHLLQMVGSRGEWGAFECLGAPATMSGGIALPLGLDGALAACSAGSDRVDVFAVSLTGELLQTSWNGKDWSGFESLGDFGTAARRIPTVGAAVKVSGGVSLRREAHRHLRPRDPGRLDDEVVGRQGLERVRLPGVAPGAR